MPARFLPALNRIALPLIVLLAAFALPGRAAEPTGRPNVLFLLADDQAFDTLHALGNDEIETPNLDRLVHRGTTFRRAYNQGGWSGAICVASRTMLTTGRFLWHAHELNPQKELEAGRFWPARMRGAGYETYFTGKWHIQAQVQQAFDHAEHVRGGMPNQSPQGYNRPLAGLPDTWKPWDKSRGGFWQGGQHWSEVVADDAIGFLRHAKESDNGKPFFMYVAFNAPHDPRQSPKEFVEKYPLEKIAVPKSFVPEYPFKEQMGAGKSLRDEQLAPFPRTEHAVQVHRQEYYASITHLDAQIGRILDALDASGQAENTHIIFTADHGLAVGRHGLMGKQNMFEHSIRVPLVLAGPGIPAGETVAARVYMQDVMPTTLELAGAPVPEWVEFQSLLPLIEGARDRQYEAIYGAYLKSQRQLTQGDHKLILYPTAPAALLYNMTEDPQELHNLADDPRHRETLRQLFAKLLEQQKRTGDTLDLRRVYPELAP
jgi:choline-sulfatase